MADNAQAGAEPTVSEVLAALADPVRLEIVRRIAAAGHDLPCGVLYDNVAKSTASYHFSLLRGAGVLEQYTDGVRRMNHLRVEELEAVIPGVLSSVLRNLPTD